MLPAAFLEKMRGLLGDEFPRYYAAVSAERTTRALRVNPLKTSVSAFTENPPFPLRPFPAIDGAFLFDEPKPGLTPAHHAGAFYVQEPSAMATVASVPIAPDMKILDLCASPGGKSTQAAAFLSENGLLVANEIVPARCKTLVGNIERMGVRNAIVLNTDVFGVSALFPEYFDLVLLDAPCSGEGMMRTREAAGEDWSPETVRMCAARQAEILEEAAKTVRPGGRLLYSTCTFSPEENEDNVALFLEKHKDFHLVPLDEKLYPYSVPAFPRAGGDMTLARRFYPHLSPGEGQFVACMRRDGDGNIPVSPAFADAARKLTKSEEKTVRDFLSDALADGVEIPDLAAIGDRVILRPRAWEVPKNHVFAAFVCLGELASGRIVPHHQFFSAYGKDFRRKIELSESPDLIAAYLRGEEIPTDVPNGYAVVTLRGAALGGVKVSGGRAKNHYPKGLRQNVTNL